MFCVPQQPPRATELRAPPQQPLATARHWAHTDAGNPAAPCYRAHAWTPRGHVENVSQQPLAFVSLHILQEPRIFTGVAQHTNPWGILGITKQGNRPHIDRPNDQAGG